MRKYGWIGLGLLAVIAIAAVVYLRGTVIISGKTDTVERAVISNGEATQPLTRLLGGVFFAFPEIEGAIEATCLSGEKFRAGYVTPHRNTRVSGESLCKPAA